MQNITKAVIPAAGLGTRMEPISNYLPKPMLPLGKKPVLQYIIEELQGAGINEIAVVIRNEHQMIREYFPNIEGLNFIYDDSTSGPGGAILKAANFVGRDNFVVVFSDAPMNGDDQSAHIRKLIDLKGEENEAVVSIYSIPQSEVSSRGVVAFDQEVLLADSTVQLTGIFEKPTSNWDKEAWASSCRYVLGPKILEALKEIDPDGDGELQLTSAIQFLMREGETVIGHSLPKNIRRYDTGNFEGYFKAFRDFSANALS